MIGQVLPRMREWIEILWYVWQSFVEKVLPRMREWIEIKFLQTRVRICAGSPSYEGVD